VPPYSAYVEYNGWPFAVFDALGGVAGAGTHANEDTFIAAVKAATAPTTGLGGAGS
jgi:hypothetical protein